MVVDDALSIAKSAALKDLLSRSVSHHGINHQPANGPGTILGGKTRRRRRRRHQQSHQQRVPSPLPVERPDVDVDYVPEPVKTVVSAAEQISDEGHAAAVGQIVSAINRFVEMGPNAVDNEQATRENESDLLPSEKPSIGQEQSNYFKAFAEVTNGSAKQNPQQPLSRKRQKEQRRALIARLKEVADKPEVVESWDVNSPDPILLVHLKAYSNSVPVPVNWSQKRKYLQNKRGMEKPPFQLPAYIMDTGVGSLRDAQIEADEKKTLKQRQREKMRAKTGRGVEIDTQRLHDAFFKFQTKPHLTKHGEVYYELKELETDGSHFIPGFLSEELRAALGITVNDPPPWLINMQRYGPPTSYPGLRIPGVNASIPPGASFGYQVGGWGKPPVDPSGRPIYGDVFGEGLSYGREDPSFEMPQAEKDYLWGEVKSIRPKVAISAADVKSDEEDEDEDDSAGKETSTGWTPTQLPKTAETEKTDANVDEGQRSAERKEMGHDGEVRKGIAEGQLFTVLEQRKASVGNSVMMGSTHIYNVEKPYLPEARRHNGADTEAHEEAVMGQMSEKENGVDKRKRDVNEKDAKRGRATKKHREFKF